MSLMLRQHKYIFDILTQADMTSHKPVDTPISTFKVTILPDPLFLILHGFVKLQVLFNILTFRDQLFALLLTKSVNLCMLLHILIGVWLNTFCIIYGVQPPMAYISIAVPPLLYVALQIQIEQVVVMIISLRVIIQSSLVRLQFHGNQANNA